MFTQHWVCIGHLGGSESPGSFQSGTYLDMPWVVTRADDGELRAFHNVSVHAGFSNHAHTDLRCQAWVGPVHRRAIAKQS